MLSGWTPEDHDKAKTVILGHLQDAAPKATGAGAKALRMVDKSALSSELFGPLHMWFTIAGTKEHDIWANHKIGHTRAHSGHRPLSAQSLGFLRIPSKSGGGFAFLHMVHHPGSHANAWREAAIESAKPELNAIAREAAHRIIAELRASLAP